MKIGDVLLPEGPVSAYDLILRARLYDVLRPMVRKLNGIGSGSFTDAADNAAAAIPTTGTYRQGDFVANNNPTELGAVAAKYVLMGWVCVASGTPGTWRESRTLTGN